jgi:RNA polymerase sigma-70 factor, ECF subfamily
MNCRSVDRFLNQGSLGRVDREVLTLSHFEEIGRAEAVPVFGIPQARGTKLCLRALKRLRNTSATLPGGWESL